MKGLVCSVCGYVHMEDTAPEKCPVCFMSKTFSLKEDALKTSQDVAVTGESEKKHIPSILVVEECGLIPGTGCVDVHVKIGEIPHPMTPEHSIRHIDYYIDKKFVGRMSLTSSINAAAVIHLKGGTKGTISVVENCNIHGSWYNETTVQLKK